MDKIKSNEILVLVEDNYFHIIELNEQYSYSVYNGNLKKIKGNDEEGGMKIEVILEEILVEYYAEQDSNDLKWTRLEEIDDFFERVEQFQSCIFPDPLITVARRDSYGYIDDLMLPLSQEKALEFFAKDIPIFILYDDNTERQVYVKEEIENSNYEIFGVEYSEWNLWKGKLEYLEKLTFEQIEKAEQKEANQDFQRTKGSSFAIYRLKREFKYQDMRFKNLKYLRDNNMEVDYNAYATIYNDFFSFSIKNKSKNKVAELLRRQFRKEISLDFQGYPLSVSDIIAIKIKGNTTYFYIDDLGIVEQKQLLSNPR